MRAGLGLTRANFVGTGAAPLDNETLSFFAKFGMTITDIWGEPARIDNRPGERLETVCLCVRNHVVGNRKLKLFFSVYYPCLSAHTRQFPISSRYSYNNIYAACINHTHCHAH